MPKTQHIEHLHPEAALYAHHAETLLAHAEASKQSKPVVEVANVEVKK